ncbi:AI-2E family transporter [Agilicoccus flavus]|uniref:AI-2E family transporter n=1 Tax=Agilicoccus flavus TaxID=2775968 RepID=UPI001CF69158|nr:AI-2E family transporter [Agilicoccus flavus]
MTPGSGHGPPSHQPDAPGPTSGRAGAPEGEAAHAGAHDGGFAPARIAGRAKTRLSSMTQQARARLQDHERHERWDPAEGQDGVLPVLDLRAEDPTGRSVPGGIKEAAAWCWRLLLIAATVYLAVRVLASVPIVTVPFVVALLLTAVLGPVQKWLHRSVHIPHSLAAFVALLVGVAVIGVIGTFVGAQISANAPRMATRFIQFIDTASHWLRNGPLQVSDEQVKTYGDEITAAISRNQESLVTGALSTLSALSHAIAGALLLLLSTFFLLRDGNVIWGWILSLLPARSRARLDQVGRYGWHTLGGYMRGQTIIAALHASTIFVVLFLLDVPMAVALSVLIFVGSYVPLLGMTVTGAFCIVVSLIEHGPGAALVVGITIVVLVQLEAHLLQPLIMARNVEVHPLGVAISVLAGTAIGGIAGALFAVPLVAFLNATVRAAHMPLGAPATVPGPSAGVDPHAQGTPATADASETRAAEPGRESARTAPRRGGASAIPGS